MVSVLRLPLVVAHRQTMFVNPYTRISSLLEFNQSGALCVDGLRNITANGMPANDISAVTTNASL